MNETARDHAAHDELLVVAYASDDLEGRDAERATDLVARCADCSRLAADIRELRTNVAALPAPRRTRDFRLTEADAARLRPAGWRGLLALLGGPRLAFAAPVGTAIATLGIAGLLVATAPSLFMAGTASAPAAPASGGASVQSAEGAPGPGAGTSDTGVAAVPAPSNASAAASAAVAEPYAASSAGPDQSVTSPPLAAAPNPASATGPAATGPAQAKSAAGPAASAEAQTSVAGSAAGASSGGPSPLAMGSAALVLVGLLLIAARFAARRSQA